MKELMSALAAAFLCVHSLVSVAAEAEFPHRALYPAIPTIELTELHKQFGKVVIFDVRSKYEYDTLHIKDAKHLALDDPSFVNTLVNLRKQNQSPFVFYCNGHTCKKSYKATKKARDGDVSNVSAFDAGILSWTKAHPDLAVLLGKSPVDLKSIISKENLRKHMLKPSDFSNRIGADTILLDIRENVQKYGINLFPMQQKSVPLDNNKLEDYIKQAKSSSKTLLIYDAAGKQVRWLQYFLESEKLDSYYFMEGGAQAFLAY